MEENYNLLEPHHFGEKPPRRVNNLYLWIMLGAVAAVLILSIHLERTPEKGSHLKETADAQTEVRIEYQQTDEGRETPAATQPRQGGASPAASQNNYRRVAIIIDDLGYDLQAAKKFIEMEAPLSFAILPQVPHSRQIAELAHENGRLVMVHLPMEPQDYPETNPGPGTIFSYMSRQEIISMLERDLASVPGAVGINNHMGSRLTTDAQAMETVMSYLKSRDLFFIDSLTAPGTVAHAAAKTIGLKAARRDFFLDNVQDVKAITENIMLLAAKAKKVDGMIAIAHPHPETYQALKETLPLLADDGIRVVPVSELVR